MRLYNIRLKSKHVLYEVLRKGLEGHYRPSIPDQTRPCYQLFTKLDIAFVTSAFYATPDRPSVTQLQPFLA